MDWTNFRLVNWLSSVSPLSLACLVLLFSQAGFLIFGLKKLKNLRNLSLMKGKSLSVYSTNSDSKDDSSDLNGKLDSPSTPRIVAALMVALVSASLLAWAAGKQHGYCTASGDYWESKGFTLGEPDKWERSWKYTNDDGGDGTLVLCPTSDIPLKKGLHFKYAKYEMRNGCMDFSGLEAKYEIK